MIHVSELNFTYPKNRENTLHNLCFKVNKAEIFGFVGPSGAGKSTTVKILIGLLKNYRGKVNVLHQEANRVNKDFYENLGVSFEVPNLYEKFTAIENLNFFKGLYKNTGLDPLLLLSMVGLQHDAHTRVDKFSKGMKIRLNFIRALQHNPDLFFLDEPTSGLDPANARGIMDIILDLKSKGKTIFLTTHNMTVAEDLCDKLAFLVDGNISLIDSPRNLKLKYGKKSVKVEYKKHGSLHSATFALKGLGKNKEYLRVLNTYPIETIHSEEARLDDVFIKVTGRRLV
ncbi:MAG: ABC transporter ATP-binding protein [Spirochaetales bacterium]|nr:ABC transporter ATP-binding protein [Spirochaetales bacterium]